MVDCVICRCLVYWYYSVTSADFCILTIVVLYMLFVFYVLLCGSCASCVVYFFFFFKDTATTEIYTSDTLFPYTTLFRSRSVRRRSARGRLGRGPQIHRGLHPSRAVHLDGRREGRQHGHARPRAEDAAARHRLRDLDGHRHGGYRDLRHDRLRRARRPAAARLHRPDRRGHRRPQVPDAVVGAASASAPPGRQRRALALPPASNPSSSALKAGSVLAEASEGSVALAIQRAASVEAPEIRRAATSASISRRTTPSACTRSRCARTAAMHPSALAHPDGLPTPAWPGPRRQSRISGTGREEWRDRGAQSG